MSSHTISCLSRLSISNGCHAPPSFLAPALEATAPRLAPTSRQFSTTTPSFMRQTYKDKSRKRGVSAIHRTGPRWALSMQKYPLPEPSEDAEKNRALFQTSSNHGLWQFFNAAKEPMEKPEEHAAHGRSWTYRELTYKSWEDLHRLYWVCAKERNRIATSERERKRVHAGFGEAEAQERAQIVLETQRQIKRVLKDRWVAYLEARDLWDSGVRPGEDQFVEDEVEEPTSESELATPSPAESQSSPAPSTPPADASTSRPTAQP